ncbi:unnamed protein product, partial [Rotaria sp. Silwood1]
PEPGPGPGQNKIFGPGPGQSKIFGPGPGLGPVRVRFHHQYIGNLIISTPYGSCLITNDLLDLTSCSCLHQTGKNSKVGTWWFNDTRFDG